ncbi:LPO_1073/Vpar_1526 family protein [Chryseolinea lacunae]|uniref:Uncharacterized protein n=1 Tax=Chryseolinea lacunae TaxID=2801331 RepID=A0ABS1KK91_9BACT|nr:LPO_1073/Vpar_1526 family protein [Chryseolinea lacunae]MBL0739875.1 hypothetical protein [Chryseolinea lacunae]
MINDKNQTQEGGNSSTNFQGGTIVVNNGLSYKEAKEIAQDVFNANFLELSTKAAAVSHKRAEELVECFLEELKKAAPENINTVEDPGMQFALYNAQVNYAKTGDRDLADLLVKMLIDRSYQKQRNFHQIVLDESLNTVAKLTTDQVNTLTVVFVLKYTSNKKVKSPNELCEMLTKMISPFAFCLKSNSSLYQHLEFSACASVTIMTQEIGEILRASYGGLFQRGLSKEEIEAKLQENLSSYPELIRQSYRDESLFQINALNDRDLESYCAKNGIEGVVLAKLKAFFQANTFDNSVIEQEFLMLPGFEILFDVWKNSSLSTLDLTTVGMAIGQANLKAKAGISIELDSWFGV